MKWIWLILAAFMVVFFGRIFYVGFDHKEYTDHYEEQCNAKGGVVIKDTGKGWTRYYCIDKDAIITIERGSE